MTEPRADRWYRGLLRLLPFEFRAEFGSQMEDAFREEDAEVRAQRRLAETAKFWWRTLADVAQTALRQHAGELRQDARVALRLLRRSPGFAAAAVLTLALAIGATTAVFAVVNAVILRPLPYPDADRLVFLTNTSHNLDRRPFGGPLSYPQFLDVQSEVKALDAVGVVQQGASPLYTARHQTLPVVQTSAALFSVMGGRVVLGRPLAASDERQGAPPVAVLSHRAWLRLFGGDVSVIGRTLARQLSDREATVTIVGVLAPDVAFPSPLWTSDFDAWLPLDAEWVNEEGYLSHNRRAFVFKTFGRLALGATLAAAQDQVTLFSKRHAEEYKAVGGGTLLLKAVPLNEELVGDSKAPLTMFLGAVVVLLLIASVNVATLLLARASPRHQEFAVRTALGAGRLRLARQLLTESALLCVMGGTAGVVIAHWSLRAFILISPAIPRLSTTRLDMRVLAFAGVVVAAAAMITGLAPAIQFSRRSVLSGLQRAAAPPGRWSGWRRPLWMMLSAQLALALVLLASGALMLNSFVRLVRFDLGFDASSTLLVPYHRSDWEDRGAAGREEAVAGVVTLTNAERRSDAVNEEVRRRVAGLPGVVGVARTTNPPLGGGKFRTSVDVDGRMPPPGSPFMADIRSVSPDYLRMLGLRLLRGRAFTPNDREGTPRVVVVNETSANSLWGGVDPLGRRVKVLGRWAAVVGIVADVRHMGPRAEPEPELYTVDAQEPRQYGTLVVRVESSSPEMEAAIVRQIRSADPNIDTGSVRRFEDLRSDLLAPTRFAMLLLGSLSLMALALVLVGVHAVVACLVEQKRHEIGVRIALGATAGRVERELVGRAVGFAFVGILVGLAGALGAGSWIRGLLFGIGPDDGATLSVVAVGLLTAVVVGTYRPAHRAASIDPVICLKAE